MKPPGLVPEYVGSRTPSGGVAKFIRYKVCDVNNGDRNISHTPDAVFCVG